ncbi:MAG: hypothetical protein FWG40_03220, partial [Peptococcaceae bacterium]|nr:hypothetical protein [Peptococcaceae bacterium]
FEFLASSSPPRFDLPVARLVPDDSGDGIVSFFTKSLHILITNINYISEIARVKPFSAKIRNIIYVSR